MRNLVALDVGHPDVVQRIMDFVEARDSIDDATPQRDVCTIQDQEVHELCSVTGAKACIVDLLRLVVKLKFDRSNLETLNERLFSRCLLGAKSIILEFEETRDEIECILIDVQP